MIFFCLFSFFSYGFDERMEEEPATQEIIDLHQLDVDRDSPISGTPKFKSYYQQFPKHLIDGIFLIATGVTLCMDWSFEWIPLIAGYLLADFTSAHFHWLEDTYDFLPKNEIICNNRLHHLEPRRIIETPFIKSIQGSALAVAPFLAAAIYLDVPDCIVYSLLFTAMANWIHQMAHQTSKEIKDASYIIWLLQKAGIMQSREHHRLHHFTKERETHYCVMTDYLNPLLEKIDYWRKLESLIHFITQSKPRALQDAASYFKHCHQKDPQQWAHKVDKIRKMFEKK